MYALYCAIQKDRKSKEEKYRGGDFASSLQKRKFELKQLQLLLLLAYVTRRFLATLVYFRFAVCLYLSRVEEKFKVVVFFFSCQSSKGKHYYI